MIDEVKTSQEAEYWFPYHYIARMPQHGFTQHFVDTWGLNYISTMEFMLGKLTSLAPSSVVDIGCGDGRFTREIGLRFSNTQVLGVDYSEHAISLARAMNQDLTQIVFESRDIIQSPLKAENDVAILMEVFEHIHPDDCAAFLNGVRASLKREGQLLLTVPHANKPVEYKHYRHFTIASITESLSPFFNIVEVLPFERHGWLRHLLTFFLCNRFFVLNHGRLLNIVYRLHSKFLFYCKDEKDCQRIFVLATPKSNPS